MIPILINTYYVPGNFWMLHINAFISEYANTRKKDVQYTVEENEKNRMKRGPER